MQASAPADVGNAAAAEGTRVVKAAAGPPGREGG